MNNPNNQRRHETWLGEHITGPIAETMGNVVGSILSAPFRVADWAIDKTTAGVRNAVMGIVGFPVKKK